MSQAQQSSLDAATSSGGQAKTATDSLRIDALPFKSPRFRQLCVNNLPWNDSDITSFIIKHALPYLKHWRVTCYDDVPRRSALSSLLATPDSFEATRNKILAICTKHEGSLFSQRFFASLPAGPIRHVARTAVSVHLLCFSRLPVWSAAFDVNEDTGYGVVAELLLEMFQNLEKYGAKSWFHSLLETESKPAVSKTARVEKSHKRKLEPPETNNQVGSVERSPKKSRVDEPKRKQSQDTEGATKKAPAKKQVTANTTSTNPSIEPKQEPSATQTPPNKKSDGRGLPRTRARNARNREQKKLKRFKAAGLIPPDANFATLRTKQAELKADREHTSERAKQKAAEKAHHEAEAEAKRPKRLRVTLKFTGHRKELFREIVSTGRAEARKRNELAKLFPHYLGERAQAQELREEVESAVKEQTRLEDWDDSEYQKAMEWRAARKKLKQTNNVVEQVREEKGDCLLGAGCPRKTAGGECVMCSTFGKV